MAKQNYIGRRKTSTARVYFKPGGNGNIQVNNKKLEEFFPLKGHQNTVLLPLQVCEAENQYDVKVTVRGGGITGQADAIQLGIARGLDNLNEENHDALKSHDLLSRDDRMVERKKYGLHKARKRPQYSKR